MSQLKPSSTFSTGNSNTVLSRILKRYITRWPYFLFALLVALTCAYGYLRTVKNVYEIKASLVIKDKDKIDKDKTDLQELDLGNPAKKVEIEIEVFKSRQLVNKVINDLKIGASYSILKNNEKIDVYKTAPFIYQPVQPIPYGKFQVNIKIVDTANFEIINPGRKTKIGFNKPFKNDIGMAIIKPTANLRQYIGSTIIVTLQDTDAVINNYQGLYEARLLDKQQPVVELSIHDQDVDRGKDFLNHIIAEYNKNNTEEKNLLTKNTLFFIDRRLDSLSGELNHVEKNIEGYKSSRGITDISAQSNSYLQSIQSNDTRLNEVNVQLRIINGIEKYINSPGNNNVPATIGIEDKGLVNLIEQLAKLQLERTKLLATTPETNYLFEPLKRQIQSTTAAIRENVNNIKASLLNIKAGLQTINSSVETSIKDLPGQERGYISIKRQQSIKENLYNYLLQKREQAALSYASTLTDVNVIDNAYVSAITWPKKPIVFVLAILIALSVTATIVFFIDMAGNKTSSVAEVEEILETPVLNELVYAKTNSSLVVVDKKQLVISQQFRSLRTNLNYLHASKGNGRVILITSGKSGEGKSFVTTNMGLSIAASGRKTVIIDFDLHKPSIREIFDRPLDHSGVSDFLMRQASVEDIIQPSAIFDNLDIITSGSKVANPSELIENNLLGELINNLKVMYQDIILDTPPLRLVTDAYALSAYCNLSLYIIRKGVTRKTELAFIKKLYHEQRLPKLNLIFNAAAQGKLADTIY